MSAIYDVGLQLERTLLAWRRTCLALAVGIALAVRYGADAPIAVTAVIALPALLVIGLAYAATALRYRAFRRALADDPNLLTTGGGTVTGVAVVAVVLGVVSLAFVLGALGGVA
ncbi:DUF202 domain-containing protein [Microcella sp.]|uniref:DUF202 domain-containing protein n=1 Tax=Microcella sp. TaxID=1913979 RepID=UPI003F720952